MTDPRGGLPVGLQIPPAAVKPFSVPMTTVPARMAGEPYLSTPTPFGWELIEDADSPVVRAALVNRGLRAFDFTPVAVITLADVSEDSTTVGQALRTEQAGVEAQPEICDVTAHDGTVCGYTARTLRYRYEGRDATTVIVAGTDWWNRTWVCTVGIQTAAPDDSRFVSDKATILGNFQFLVLQGGGISK